MDENAIHQWIVESFGPVQGELVWNQIQSMPSVVRDQLFSQDVSKLPRPSEVQAMMQAFTSQGFSTVGDMTDAMQGGSINAKLASSIATAQANDESSEKIVSAENAQEVRQAMSEANLWLDTTCDIDPAHGEVQVQTRADWVSSTLDAWVDIASPVAQATNDALAEVMTDRLGDSGEISGVFAGPIPISIPDNMKDPASLVKMLGSTAFAMQLGNSAGEISHEVHGSFDQGIALQNNPAGAIVAQNVFAYADDLGIDKAEVLAYVALEEAAHARLFANVPWLMPRFKALIGKYARGVDIDLDAVEEQLRDATSMDPESLSGAVDLSKVAIPDTPEQQEALRALENLLDQVEGWVDCVTWHAGMAHIPHIEQLREMARRERAVGGPTEHTFSSLLGLKLKPKRMREAAALWERLTAEQGVQGRDHAWSHPDLLPQIDDSTPRIDAQDASAEHPTNTPSPERQSESSASADTEHGTIDWDAELAKLLRESDMGAADQGGTNHNDSDEGGSAQANSTDSGAGAPDSSGEIDTASDDDASDGTNRPAANGGQGQEPTGTDSANE